MAANERIWTAGLVVIGDEILSGRTHDKNIAQVASWLQVQGIRLSEVRVVPDVEERIVEAVDALRAANDYLFTTGGIGPTHDGIRIGNMFLMAGVPHITAGMLDALTGELEGGAPLLSETIGCWTAESEVADLLRQVEKAHEAAQIGSYPFFRDGKVGANFVIRSTDAEALARCVDSLCEALSAAGREFTRGGI